MLAGRKLHRARKILVDCQTYNTPRGDTSCTQRGTHHGKYCSHGTADISFQCSSSLPHKKLEAYGATGKNGMTGGFEYKSQMDVIRQQITKTLFIWKDSQLDVLKLPWWVSML